MQLALEAAMLCEIKHSNGQRTVQGHSRSPILVLIESSYATKFLLVNILTCVLSHTASKLLRYVGQIIAFDTVPLFNSLVWRETVDCGICL